MLRAIRIDTDGIPIADCPAAKQHVVEFMEKNKNSVHRIFDGDWSCIENTDVLLASLGFDSYKGNISKTGMGGRATSQSPHPAMITECAFVPYRLLMYEEDMGPLQVLVKELQEKFPCPYTEEEREELMGKAFAGIRNVSGVRAHECMNIEEHRAARQDKSVLAEFEQMFPGSVARAADAIRVETSADGMQDLSIDEQWDAAESIVRRLARRPEGLSNTVFYDECENADDDDNLAFADSADMGEVLAKWCLVRKAHPITAVREVMDEPTVLLSVMMGCEQEDEEGDCEICREDIYLSSNMSNYIHTFLNIIRSSGISYNCLVYELYRRHIWEVLCCYGKDAAMHGYSGGIESMCQELLSIDMPAPTIHQIREDLRGRGSRGYRMIR